jgi:hypothetical protein
MVNISERGVVNVNVFRKGVLWGSRKKMTFKEARSADGFMRGRTTLQFVESTVQRDILEAWVLVNGLATSGARPTIWELLNSKFLFHTATR